MRPLKQDFSIFQKLELERQPVGIKYEFFKPEGFEKLDRTLAICEAAKVASERSKPFYITEDNEDCAGKGALGMKIAPPWAECGEIGPEMKIFQDSRANQRCMDHYKTFKHGQVNFAIFARMDCLSFEPDLMIFVAPPDKTEILLRAMAYSTGAMYESVGTPVFQCSWLYTYPVITGKVNYIMTGLSFGQKGREVYPPGLAIVAIPYQWLPTVIANLNEMEWVLPAWQQGSRENWMKLESAYLAGIHQKAIDQGFIKPKK
jgi:uncharacterized protein (DUF169 family)